MLNFLFKKEIFFYVIIIIIFCFLFSCGEESKKIKTIIDTNPSSAKTFVNDEYIGQTPIVYMYSLKENKVDIAFNKKNFHIYKKKNYHLQPINKFELLPKSIPLEVIFIPAADYIYLDEKLIQTENLITGFPEGEYSLNAFRKGSYPISTKIVVNEKSTKFRFNFKPINSRSMFSINSAFSEVEIYFNNFFIGYLPYREKLIKKYPYEFTFKKKGYVEKNWVFSSPGLRNKVMNISLTPKSMTNFTLGLIGLPKKSTISLLKQNQVVYKTQNPQVAVSYGEYVLEVTHPQYFTYHEKVDVKKDMNLTIDLVKKPLEPIILIHKKEIDSYSKFTLSSVAFDEKYFFINDFEKKEKVILDNSLNLVEKINFPPTKHLLKPILDQKIFGSDVHFFEKMVYWNQTLYRKFREQEKNFQKITFADFNKNKLLIVDQELQVIHVFALTNQVSNLSEKEWNKLDEVNFSILKQFKENFLPNVIWGPAYLVEEKILFLEKQNQELLFYDLNTKTISSFVKEFDYKPIVIETFFVFQYLVLVKTENKKIIVFDKKGNYLYGFFLPETFDDEILDFIIKKNYLYIFGGKNIFLYKWN